MVPKFCLGAIAKDEFPTGHRLVLPDVETPPVQRRFSGKGYEAITRGSDHEEWPSGGVGRFLSKNSNIFLVHFFRHQNG